ncbi:MAG TPA: carboxypeptidase-like regulatory domain-containing protein [Bryobacteraceae bacterium]|nr:carboxypeptidase-like regulatory domain-containing protein [Bryobacteraceae bacterium]
MLTRSLILFTVSVWCVVGQQGTGSLQGNVDDDKGQHLSKAFVVISPRSAGAGSAGTVLTGPNGEFSLSGLKPGNYSVCVQYPGDPHLDPCVWSTAPQVTIAAGTMSSVAMPKVVKGSLFVLQIGDPSELWAANDDFLVGVTLPSSRFFPLRLVTRSATGRSYDLAVPFDTPMVVSLWSTHLVFADDKGRILGNTASIAFKHVAGGNNARLSINVASRN